jgi:hypothetical protein
MASHDGLPVSSWHDTFGRRALELGVAAHVAISHIWHEPDLRRCPHLHFSRAARPESVSFWSKEGGVHMKRRDVITLLGFLSLGGFAMLWRNMGSFWRLGPNEHIASTVAAVADLMFPGDGLPGASELGLHKRIVAMPELHALMTRGVVWLDNRAALQGASDFLALDEASRLAAVDAAFGSHDDDTQQFVLALRYHLGTAYYTEPAVKSAFAYTGPPQPDGFADFQDRPA